MTRVRATGAIALLALLMALAACGDSEVGDRLPSGTDDAAAAPGTAAQETPATEAPADPTTPADEPAPADPAPTGEDDGSTVPALAIGAVVVVILLILLLAFGRRGRSAAPVAPQPAAAPARSAWSQRAHSAYANARWLYDALAPGSASRPPPELDDRQSAALTELYGLEADAPTATARMAVRETGSAVRELRAAIDSLAALPPPAPGVAPAPGDPYQAAVGVVDGQRNRLAAALNALAETLRATP